MGREALQEVWVGLGDQPRSPGGDGRPSQRSGRDRYIFQEVR